MITTEPNTTDQPAPPASKRSKAGAPRGNRNAFKHGVYGFLALGRLPAGASYVARQLNELRRALTAAVEAAHGEVTLHKASLIQTVCRAEGRAVLLGRWLRDAGSLPLADRLALLHESAAAVEARDKAIRALKIDQASDRPNPWAALNNPPAANPSVGSRSFDPALAPPGVEVDTSGGPTS